MIKLKFGIKYALTWDEQIGHDILVRLIYVTTLLK
jgi:hypothetical protein